MVLEKPALTGAVATRYVKYDTLFASGKLTNDRTVNVVSSPTIAIPQHQSNVFPTVMQRLCVASTQQEAS